MEDIEEIEDSPYKFVCSLDKHDDFSGFEGPMDVLLKLIKDANMEIKDVEISVITEQYLNYIDKMEILDMDESSSFLLMASWLLEMKSKALLPKDDLLVDEEDPLDEQARFKMLLEEYNMLKEAGEELQQFENVDRFYKQPDKSAGDTRIVFKDYNLEKMLDAFAIILMKTKDRENPQEKKISRDRWTVADKIAFLNSVLTENKQINFFELFDQTYSKLEVITVFLAILELLKFQKIEVVQTDKYGDITIRRKENQDEPR